MKLDYKVAFTATIIFTLIILSSLLLFGCIAATQIEATTCEPNRIHSDCIEFEKIPICPTRPNPNTTCPRYVAKERD